MTFPYPTFPLSTAFGFASVFDYGAADVMQLVSGAVVSAPARPNARRTFEFGYSVRNYADAVTIRDIMHDVRIGAFPILIRDWADYEAEDESFGVGDGTSSAMPLYKTYGSFNPVTRQIKYPEPTDLVVRENGVVKAITSSTADGVVPTAPWTDGATLTWSGTFYCAARLSVAGSMQVSGPLGKFAELPQLSAIEDLHA